MRACIVISLLPGARTKEVRALTWTRIDLVGSLLSSQAVPIEDIAARAGRVGTVVTEGLPT